MLGSAIRMPAFASLSPLKATRRTAVAQQHRAAGSKRSSLARGKNGRRGMVVRAGPVQINEDDLLQVPDRIKWYESKFCADDMPDWNMGTFISSHQVSPEYRAVHLQMEISRERVPLRNGYKMVGQRLRLRVNSGAEVECTVASPPFSDSLNRLALFNVRGDMHAGETKTVKELTTVQGDVVLLVSKREAADVYGLEPMDVLEVGPFVGGGLDLHGSPLGAIYSYPTLIIFVAGKGIATAKALLESHSDVASCLNIRFRRDVHVYYKAPNEASMCFKEDVPAWEETGVQLYTSTRGFQDAFDDDDSLMYDPDYTGAIILTAGDAESEAEARQVCTEAGLAPEAVLSDARDAAPPLYHTSTPKTFLKWSQAHPASVAEGDEH